MGLDSEQLRLFAANRSEAAFADLVQRHLRLVYSTALRRVTGDDFLAQDIAQEVFRDLSLKAKALTQHPCLASWLYRATCFASAKAVRKEERQRNRKTATAMLLPNKSEAEEAHANPALLDKLDAAMSALKETERQAVLLRFFEGRQLREVGLELGVSEEAARKRVQRAVEKLRLFFQAEGIHATASATFALLAALSAVAIPDALGAVVCEGAISVFGAKTMVGIGFMAKVKSGLITLAIAGSVTTAIFEYRAILNLRREMHERELNLQRRDDVTAPNDQSEIRVQVPKLSGSSNNTEVLRLRDLVTRQQRDLQELQAELSDLKRIEHLRKRLGGTDPRIETHRGSPFAPNHYYPRELWADVGLESPEATLQTALWAASSGRVARLMEAINLPTQQKEQFASSWTADTLKTFPGAGAVGLKIEASGGTLGSPRIEYIIVIDGDGERQPDRAHFYLDNVDGKWRLAPNISMEGGHDEYLIPR